MAVPARKATSQMRVAPSACFPPLADPQARILILGSLPGQTSLDRRQYYAQPQNAFWRIMGSLFGAVPELGYDERVQRLMASGVALWDVCASACRPGSLDASIVAGTVTPNEFGAFFARHPHIAMIAFNGATAATLYGRHVHGSLDDPARRIPSVRLPSTSPAHASLSFEAKLALWKRDLAC